MKFEDFELDQGLLRGIQKAGFKECMKVQEECLKETLKKKDVYVQSQTGTGKTAAFIVTILELYQREQIGRKRALIIVPTRELAVQIEREAKLLGEFLPYKIGSVYGGVGYAEQEKMLREGYEIIIGTPGRLLDFEKSKKLNFRDISVLVIDEADRLFDMGFLPDLRRMLRRMQPTDRRTTMLFSATLTTRVWQLAWEHMNDPLEIIMNPEQLTVEEITQELYHVSRNEKTKLLLGILNKENPENALIFTNTKNGAYEICQRLTHNGFSAKYIIGDLPQKKRIRAIDQLKSGELNYLVATDVAARGLHVDDLDMVINYDLPEDPENYVHRIGRTARAGNTGKAVSLACERFVYSLESIEELIHMKIPVIRAEEDLYSDDSSSELRFDRPRRGASHGEAHRSGPRRQNARQHHRSDGHKRRDSHAQRANHPTEKPQPGNRSVPGRKPVNRPHSRPAPQKSQPEQRRPVSAGASGKTGKTPVARGKDQGNRVSRNVSIDERLEYYRKKYGDSFKVSQQMPPDQSGSDHSGQEKDGLFSRIFKRTKNK